MFCVATGHMLRIWRKGAGWKPRRLYVPGSRWMLSSAAGPVEKGMRSCLPEGGSSGGGDGDGDGGGGDGGGGKGEFGSEDGCNGGGDGGTNWLVQPPDEDWTKAIAMVCASSTRCNSCEVLVTRM